MTPVILFAHLLPGAPLPTSGATAFALRLLQEGGKLRVDQRAPGDTMTVFHPPPDISPVERVIRWFFSVPQWVQVSGAILAVIVGIIAVIVLWKQRMPLIHWVRRQHEETPAHWKVAGAVAALVVLIVLGTSGFAFFNYSQHNNQFCISCHTLHDEVYMRFQQSKHHTDGELTCHDCHKESMFASMMQVVSWMSKRPEEVGPHAPVPREVCENCHVKENPDSTWQRIVATAGHSVHLFSDSAKTKEIECLTCHGVTAHRFRPVAETCGQSSCHEMEDTQIRLGEMSNQSGLHCTMCHRFTAPVRQETAVDTARVAMIPSHQQCLGCHEMKEQMAKFVPEDDPHDGQCGACHNPHEQQKPDAAFESCATNGCHARADTVSAFHRGIPAASLEKCGSCHVAHTWTVRGEACLSCHEGIFREASSRRSDASGALLRRKVLHATN